MENRNVKYCQDCGKVALLLIGPKAFAGGAGDGDLPVIDWTIPMTQNRHKFIATRYCAMCSEWRRAEFNRYRQRRHRRKHSYEKWLLRQEIRRLAKDATQWRQMFSDAATENATLKREIDEAYQRGQQDARHSLTGRVLEGLGNRLSGARHGEAAHT